ncbi:MAG: RelA/SpoT family protein [Mangrovibacterium sp.]
MEESNVKMTLVDRRLVNDYYDELKRSYGNRISPDGAERIHKAYLFACDAHAGVKRKSGEPYIIHPIAVATIASAEIGLGATAIVSALLHDVIEDTEYTYDDISKLFGEEVAKIVDGLTKLSNEYSSQQDSKQAVNFKKMLLTLSDDVRVMLIKLADRLHNMRTLGSMAPLKQLKISSETLYIFSPLAHRLGLYAIKTELEDLSLKYTDPLAYEEIRMRLRNEEEQRTFLINEFIRPIEEALQLEGFDFKITGRLKSVYSIWNKMKKQNISFDEVYDLLAIRIIFKPMEMRYEKRLCFDILAILTDIYKSKPERIRDWVSMPKTNGYEALHVTVMGPNGRWIEVQIRSERMDEIAERGFAAHYKYKENNLAEESELDRWLSRIRETLSHNDGNAEEFVDEVKMNLNASDIVVFTPKGRAITLPHNSCIIDFAFAIHSELGNQCIGAKVNHKLVPISHQLQSGDQVDVLTSKTQKPSRDWLNFICSSRAQSGVKMALRLENREYSIEGKKMIEELLQRHHIRVSLPNMKQITQEFNLSNKEQLFSQVGLGTIRLEDVERILVLPKQNLVSRYFSKAFGFSNEEKDLLVRDSQISTKELFVVKEYENEMNYSFSECCMPIPGDSVMGYLGSRNHVFIHRMNCSNATKLMSQQGDQVVGIEWSRFKKKSYPVSIRLSGFDRSGLLNEITAVISKLNNIVINAVYFDADNGIFNGKMRLHVHEVSDLQKLMDKLLKVSGIDKVIREDKVSQGDL